MILKKDSFKKVQKSSIESSLGHFQKNCFLVYSFDCWNLLIILLVFEKHVRNVTQKIKKWFLKIIHWRLLHPRLSFLFGEEITKMAIKWPSLYPRTQFLCKKLCMEEEKVIKQILLKYVEYLLRYWHFSLLPNLKLNR
jgi:hypothetical protein